MSSEATGLFSDYPSQPTQLIWVLRTRAVRWRAAPLAVQLAHSGCVTDDGTLANAAVADDRSDRPTVA